MAKSKRSGGKFSLFHRVYSPINHLLSATRKVGRSAVRRSGSILDSGLGFFQNTGKTVSSEANAAARGLFHGTRRRRGARRGGGKRRAVTARRGNRKSRRNTRRGNRR